MRAVYFYSAPGSEPFGCFRKGRALGFLFQLLFHLLLILSPAVFSRLTLGLPRAGRAFRRRAERATTAMCLSEAVVELLFSLVFETL